MISGIEGELITTSIDSVDISINGLIINVVVPSSTVEVIGKIGDKVKLHTTFIHKDDSMVLYGFKDPEFKLAFEALININGIGPRLAIVILSQMAPDALAEAVVKGDSGLFKGISGVGPKTASRIVLELTGKLNFASISTISHGYTDEVFEALEALGYSSIEINQMMSRLPKDQTLSTEEKLRICLQSATVD
jgi:Holliday junction DNA helicase RuvA